MLTFLSKTPKFKIVLLCTSLLFIDANALAMRVENRVTVANSDADDKTLGQQVYIAGTRDPDWKSYRAFVAGMAVYEQRKALAPLAPLLFILRAQLPDNNMTGISIRIAGEYSSTTIPVANDGRFSIPLLPEAVEDNAELILNRKKGMYRWRPDIHTPGMAKNSRRLGDLRLECEVRWAIEQDELPFLMRKVFNASGGPCHSKQIQVDFLSPLKILSIRLVDKTKQMILDKTQIEPNGHIYLPPLSDLNWSDDAILEFQFDIPPANLPILKSLVPTNIEKP